MVGNNIAINVHFILPVSFLIVKIVVPHGKCIRVKIIVHNAVIYVHPLSINRDLRDSKSRLCKEEDAEYDIIAMGITISLAGNPNIKENNITPSNPNSLANGSKKLEIILNIDIFSTYVFDNIHIISPIGAAMAIALPRTYNVLSNIDLIITLPICGFLNGGNSRINEDGTPFNIVFDNNLDINNVIIIDNKINANSIKEELKELLIKNIVMSVIKVGNLPLHGIKALVRIAISFSLFESIILHPTTPHALHPKPIHIVSACLPWAPDLLNNLSMLKANLGKYPESSSNVNNGKNIAIGGSITDMTHAKVL